MVALSTLAGIGILVVAGLAAVALVGFMSALVGQRVAVGILVVLVVLSAVRRVRAAAGSDAESDDEDPADDAPNGGVVR